MSFKFSDKFPDSNEMTLYHVVIVSENDEVMEFDGVSDTYARIVIADLLPQASPDEVA